MSNDFRLLTRVTNALADFNDLDFIGCLNDMGVIETMTEPKPAGQHDLNPEWGHVYDWLELPPKDRGEELAKGWLSEFTKPAAEKNNAWLESHTCLCTYEGEIYRCTGASRLGDVWLASDHYRIHGYDKRVDVLACSNWLVIDDADDDGPVD